MKKLLAILILPLFLADCPSYQSTNPSSMTQKQTNVLVKHFKTNKTYSASSTNLNQAFLIAVNQCIQENNVTQLACLRYSAKVLYQDGRVSDIYYWDTDVIDYKDQIARKTDSETDDSKSNNEWDGFYTWNGKVVAKNVYCSKASDAGHENTPYYLKRCGKEKSISNKPKKTNEDLESERKKIEEEKRRIEEEKKRIAEAKKKKEEEEQKRKEANAKLYVIGSGTGFFVSSEGHVVSNDHVVGICRKVATKIEGKIINFNVINRDEVNDLGLIKGDYKSKNFLSIKSGGAEFGEDIVAFGYPLSDALSTSVKLTRGIVSSLSGPGNNYSEIQIDAAIQPGNSGGPVLNMEGQVVGVASSGLNKLYMLESTEYIPENVNFAVAATTLSNFLKANGVTISNASMNISNTKELAKIGRPATLQLFCMNTKAVYEELKKTKKHSDVLLEKVMELR